LSHGRRSRLARPCRDILRRPRRPRPANPRPLFARAFCCSRICSARPQQQTLDVIYFLLPWCSPFKFRYRNYPRASDLEQIARRMSILLFPKNDPGLGQIVRRKLHRNFVPGHDPDEMLPHFAGNVCEHIALAAEIDPEHRPRQNLGHGPFRHDLFFLRHRRGIYPRTVRPSTEPVAVSLRETLRVEVALRVPERRGYRKMSSSADVFERDAWQVFAEFLTFPPRSSFAMFLGSRE